MGHKLELKCLKCSYQVLTSGGPDRGFIAFTNTYVCLCCNSLVDLVTSQVNDHANKREYPIEITTGHECPKCLGNRFVIWDNIEKPCPRCDTKMTDKFDGPKSFVFWD
jgi:DNA-directed RNA polymerase subunit RPC12/RpoP